MPKITLITGCSGSGKTTIAEKLAKENNGFVLSLDQFYLSKPENVLRENYNFDHPDAFDWKLFEEVLEKLKKGEKVIIKVYSFKLNARTDEEKEIGGNNFDNCYVEGILVAHYEHIRKLADDLIFINVDLDLCLYRRLKRDNERGRDYDDVLTQWMQVRTSFKLYIEPIKMIEGVKIIEN